MAREAAIIETWVHPKYKEKVPIRLEKKTGEFYAHYGEHRVSFLQLQNVRDQLCKLVNELMELEWIPMLEIQCGGSFRYTREQRRGHGVSEIVEEKEPDRQTEGRGNLGIEFKRSWVAQKPNGQWLICKEWFSVDENDSENLAKCNDEAVFFTYRPMKRRLNARDFYVANNQQDGKGFSLPFTDTDRAFGNPASTHYVKYTPELWDGLNDLVRRLDEIRQRLEELLGKEEGRLRIAGLASRMLPAFIEEKTA